MGTIMNDDKYLKPPGTDYVTLNHPNGRNSSVEVAITKDHRFVFYFWFKWQKEANQKSLQSSKMPPALISIDWHRDLYEPSNQEEQDLKNLKLDSYKKIALFCWDKLHHRNDGHILSAAYLNFIGDIYVLCKQNGFDSEIFIDRYENEHTIKCFNSRQDLYDELLKSSHDEIYFDIDLDYFTESTEPSGGGADLTLMEEKDILSLLDTDSDFMKWIFARMKGMTIATEPKWCSGLSNSNKIYNILDTALFYPQLFSKEAAWKHLK